MRQQLVGRFTAKSKDGERYEIEVWQDVIESRTRGGTQRAMGLKTLVTTDGCTVSPLDEPHTYEIVDFGIKVTTDDPREEACLRRPSPGGPSNA